jgi:hypothetical protein
MLTKIKALTFLIAAAAVVFLANSWFAVRRDAAQLRATLSSEKKAIDAATGSETQRNRDLQTALAQIEVLRKRARTPQQTADELQQYLQLPVPIAALSTDVPPYADSLIDPNEPPTNSAGFAKKPEPKLNPSVSHSSSLLPAADLTTLYTYVQDCRECELKVVAANANVADMKTQLAGLTRERDAALAANRHGLWNKLKENFVWLAIGAGGAFAYDHISQRVRIGH